VYVKNSARNLIKFRETVWSSVQCKKEREKKREREKEREKREKEKEREIEREK
jgi:hypothetical protein